ncbi:MAG: hypothetical protein LBI03_10450 [Clostridiales bacterium]|jgi:cytoskeletal protein CcmA (bactofilin family)|nr:hypothetical protein [Clostridiales bacterium]
MNNTDNLILNGVSTCTGGKYDNVKVDGVITVNGNITANTLKADGVIKVNGKISGGDVSINGTCKILNDIDANNIKMNGVLNVKSNVSAELFYMDGVLDISGTLSAEDSTILFRFGSHANEVVGNKIKIERGHSAIFSNILPGIFKGKSFTADLVEGDDINLENCEIETVRGKTVNIGKGCNIKLVEYSDNCRTDSSSKVEQCIKTNSRGVR